jgi:hypothetical protein
MLCWFADCFSVLHHRLTLGIAYFGSGDELCGPLSALFQAVAYHLLAVGLPAFPVFVY